MSPFFWRVKQQAPPLTGGASSKTAEGCDGVLSLEADPFALVPKGAATKSSPDAFLAEWRMRNSIQPLFLNVASASCALAEGSCFQPIHGGIDRDQFLLSRLPKFFMDFIIVPLQCAIVIVLIARLLEILFDGFQPAG